MSDIMWVSLVFLLEINILLMFLSGLVYLTLLLKSQLFNNIPFGKLLKFFNLLLILALVIPLFNIENSGNFIFKPLISRNITVGTASTPEQEVIPVFDNEFSIAKGNYYLGQNSRQAGNTNADDSSALARIQIPILQDRGITLQQGLSESISRVLLMLTFLGLMVFCIRYMTTQRKISGLLKTAFLIRKNGVVNILVSDRIDGPFSVLIHQKKYIFIPNFMLDNKALFTLSIQHEMQHHRQGDTRMVYLLEALGCAFFYNPFCWYLTSRIQLLQELACDEQLISRKKVSPSDYSHCLLQLAEFQTTKSRNSYTDLAGTASLSSSATILKKRLLAMNNNQCFSKTVSYFFAIALLLGFAGAGYAAKNVTSNTATKKTELLTTSAEDDLYISDAAYFPADSKKAVVWVPGFIFKKESWFKMAKALQAEGIASMSINGNSVNNVRAAIQQLTRRGHTDFVLVGGSSGAKAVLNTVDQVFTTAFVSGVVTMSAVGGKALDDFNRQEPLRKLFIVSEQEKHMKTVQGLYDKSMEPKKLVVIPGQAHAQFLFYGPDKAKVSNLIKDFILN